MSKKVSEVNKRVAGLDAQAATLHQQTATVLANMASVTSAVFEAESASPVVATIEQGAPGVMDALNKAKMTAASIRQSAESLRSKISEVQQWLESGNE